MRKLAWFVVLSIALSCSEQEDPLVADRFSDYFPLRVGTVSVYDVDETTYQQNVATRSIYELKTVVIDSFLNEEEGYTYTINRFKRLNTASPWTPLESWSARVNDRYAVVSEGNISYIKLLLPLVKGQKWNGNDLNNQGGDQRCGSNSTYACDTYEITSINESFTDGATYDTTLTVTENDDQDLLVKYDVRKQVYAAGIGLVSVDKTVYNYCTTPPSCYGTQYVDTGYKYKQTLKERGTEN